MIYEYDNLVLGGSLEAVYFAFQEGYPIIYKELEKPYETDKILEAELEENRTKKELMEKMIFLLTLSNLNPFANKVETLRLEKNSLFVAGKRPWIEEVKFKNLHDFTLKETTLFKVVDYINIRKCGRHSFESIKSKDKFVKEVIFYPSPRSKMAKKDIKAISILTKEQLEDDEFSPVYSRIKVKQMMKDAGILGKKNGITNSRPAIKLEFVKREVFKDERKKTLKDIKMESKDLYIQYLMKHFNESRRT